MRADDPNLARLEEAAARLGPLLEELVLVGGCVTGLLITDPGAAPLRPTIDVDLVVGALEYAEYARFEATLRSRGFTQTAQEGDPICRWRYGDVRIDVMPVGDFLGFTNRWYGPALEAPVRRTLPGGALIAHVDAPHFVATKLEAFSARGAADPVTSHDAEDVILVVDGRPELVGEVARAAPDLRAFVAEQLGRLLDDRYFMEALSGYFDPDVAVARAALVAERLRALADRV